MDRLKEQEKEISNRIQMYDRFLEGERNEEIRDEYRRHISELKKQLSQIKAKLKSMGYVSSRERIRARPHFVEETRIMSPKEEMAILKSEDREMKSVDDYNMNLLLGQIEEEAEEEGTAEDSLDFLSLEGEEDDTTEIVGRGNHFLGGSKLKPQLKKLTVKELRALVAGYNKVLAIKGYSKMKKRQLINLLADTLKLEGGIDEDQNLTLRVNPSFIGLSNLFNSFDKERKQEELEIEIARVLKNLKSLKKRKNKSFANTFMRDRESILNNKYFKKKVEGYKALKEYKPPAHLKHVLHKEYLGGKNFLTKTRDWIKNVFRRKGKKAPKHEEEHVQTHAKIAREAYIPHHQRESNIDGYIYQKDQSHDKRAVYHNPSKDHSIIGQRGTVITDPDDVADDLNIAFGKSIKDNNSRWKEEDDFVNKAKKNAKKVSLTAHSLGTAYTKELGMKHGLESHNFNSGTSPSQLARNAVHALNPKTHTYAVNTDIISTTDPFTKNRINRKKHLDSHSMNNFIQGASKKLVDEFKRIRKALN